MRNFETVCWLCFPILKYHDRSSFNFSGGHIHNHQAFLFRSLTNIFWIDIFKPFVYYALFLSFSSRPSCKPPWIFTVSQLAGTVNVIIFHYSSSHSTLKHGSITVQRRIYLRAWCVRCSKINHHFKISGSVIAIPSPRFIKFIKMAGVSFQHVYHFSNLIFIP